MRSTSVLALLIVSVLCFSGCGTATPDGIPKLYPTTIKIVNDSNPIAQANVFLVPAEGTASGSWSVVGMTDASGMAVIETTQGDWKGQGAPEGEYTVYLTKFAAIEEPEMPADIESNPDAKAAYFEERGKRLAAAKSEIPEILKNSDTSDLKITIAAGTGANETFDLSSYGE